MTLDSQHNHCYARNVAMQFSLSLFVVLFAARCGAETQRWSVDLFPELPIGALNASDLSCRADSHALMHSLRNLTTWAFQMWDATAKRPTGLTIGSIYALGDFDECIGVRNAKYCLADVRIHVSPSHEIDKYSMDFDPNDVIYNRLFYTGDTSRIRRDIVHWALCVPESCPEHDIQDAVSAYLEKYTNRVGLNVTYEVVLKDGSCQVDRSHEYYDGGDIMFCVVMSIIVVIVVGASVWTFYLSTRPRTTHKERNRRDRFLVAISVQKTIHDLVSTDASISLSIVRFMGMVGVIMFHRGGTMMSGPLQNYDVVSEILRSLWLLPFHRGDVIVDTFFLLSGLMAIQKFMKELDKSQVRLIVERYIRLTPVYAVVIFYMGTVYYKTGSGPLWDTVVGEEWRSCRSNWWTNLLYVNNYVNEKSMCMIQAWYLPCDMHYFIASVIVIPLLVKHAPRAILPTLITLLIASIIAPFSVTLYTQNQALLYFNDNFVTAPRTHEVFRTIYIKTHMRAAAYIVGLLIGYALHAKRNTIHKMSHVHALSLAFTGFVLMIAVTYGSAMFSQDGSAGTVPAALYASLNRPAWALANAAVLVAVTRGKLFNFKSSSRSGEKQGVFINLLGKLSYAAYIIHMQFQMKYVGETRSPLFTSFFEVIRFGVGDVTITFLTAFILYIMVEGPIKAIVKNVMTPTKNKKLNYEDVYTTKTPQLGSIAKYKSKDVSLYI